MTEISFDARFPNARYPWADYDSSLIGGLGQSVGNSFLKMAGNRIVQSILGAEDAFTFQGSSFYTDILEGMKTSRQPFRFIVSRMSGYNLLFSTNMLVTLEDYSIVEDAERDGMDVTCPLKLKQYRPFGTKTARMETDENGNKRFTVDDRRPPTCVVHPNKADSTRNATVLEVRRLSSGGILNFRAVMKSNGITNPLANMAGKKLRL